MLYNTLSLIKMKTNPKFVGSVSNIDIKSILSHIYHSFMGFFEFHVQVQKCQFSIFSILTKWHFWTRAWNSKVFFGPKDFLWSIMKMKFKKNISNMSQDPQNPGFRSVKVENWNFLKKDSQDFKNSFQSGFLWICT